MPQFCFSIAIAILLTAQTTFAGVVLSLGASATGEIELFARTDDPSGTEDFSTINLFLESTNCSFTSFTPSGPLAGGITEGFNNNTPAGDSGMVAVGGATSFAFPTPQITSVDTLIGTIGVAESTLTRSCNVSFRNSLGSTDLGAVAEFSGGLLPSDQVVGVPEPSSLLFLGMLCCVFGFRAWTKRRF